MGLLECLDISRNVMRPDRRQRQAAIVAPGEEPTARPRISASRARVADVGGEEFHIAPAGGVAGIGDQRRDQVPVGVNRGREEPDGITAGSWSIGFILPL